MSTYELSLREATLPLDSIIKREIELIVEAHTGL